MNFKYSKLSAQGEWLYIAGGDENDRVTAGSVVVAQNAGLAVELGQGDDTVAVSGKLDIQGETSFDLGDGNNQFSAGKTTVTESFFEVRSGSGNDSLTLSGNLEADMGAVWIDLGHGNNKGSFRALSVLESGSIHLNGEDGNDIISATALASSGGEIGFGLGDGANSLAVSGKVEVSEEGWIHLDTGEGNDTYSFGNTVSAVRGVFELQAGGGNDALQFKKDIEAEEGGRTEIYLGDGNDVLTISGKVSALSGGYNHINMDDGNSELAIKKNLEAEDLGVNEIFAGSGGVSVHIQGDMDARDGGTNRIGAEDGALVSISKGMIARDGANSIEIADGDAEVYVGDGMEARNGGTNSIATGGGNDLVRVVDDITVKNGAEFGANSISTGDGNDLIALDGSVAGLLLDAGDGYDVLQLAASSYSSFNRDYQSWLTEIARTDGLESMNAECISLALDSFRSLKNLNWLGDLAADAGILLKADTDGAGRSLKLSDIFTNSQQDLFSAVDLGGENSNTLTIKGSLDANGVQSDSLTILGDSQDSLKLDSAWTASGQTFEAEVFGSAGYFVEYSNSISNEVLLIQAEIAVVTA